PSCGPCLASNDRVVIPASGGTLLVRGKPDSASASIVATRDAFYGVENYDAQSAAFDAHVFITSPITSDAKGTVWFSFWADAGSPLGLESGFARIPAGGPGSWTKASDSAGDASFATPAMNAAPALSVDGKTLYVAVRDGGGVGMLC